MFLWARVDRVSICDWPYFKGKHIARPLMERRLDPEWFQFGTRTVDGATRGSARRVKNTESQSSRHSQARPPTPGCLFGRDLSH